MAAHRYWRVLITQNCAEGVEGYTSMMELGLRTSIGGSSVATGGTASASSVDFGWTAAGAFDGSTGGAGWHSQNLLPGTAQWIKYDFGLGNDKDIVEFKIDVRPTLPKQWPRDFALQYSDNDSSWTTLIEVAGETDWDSTSNAKTYSANSIPNDSGVANRFWRLRATAVDGGASLGLSELRMYAGGPTNEAAGMPVYTSGVQEGMDVNLVDGAVDAFYWANWAATGWAGVKFASAKTITTIGIGARFSFFTQSPKDFVLERWDGSAYQTVFTITGATGWTSNQIRYFDSTGEVGGPPSAAAAARPVVCIMT